VGRGERIALLFGVLLFVVSADSANSVGPEDAVSIIREFGFPVFVALWFMWRVEKRFDRFTEALQNLLTAVTIMAKTVDHLSPAAPQLPPSPGRPGTAPPVQSGQG
jgi:hypothetical protein